MKKDLTLLIGGIGLGTGLMYLLDPDRGRRRRASLRDRALHTAHSVENWSETTARDVRNRAQGVAAEARARFVREEISDEVMVARVRSAMGRVVSHPHAVQVRADGGRIILAGPVLAEEADRLIATVTRVRGVRGVESRLELHPEPGNVPGLQGGSNRPMRYGLARANWDPATRLMVAAAGGALSVYGAARRDTAGALMGIAGLGMLGRAATNLPADRLTGIGAGRRAIELRKTLNIAAPPEEVFAFCAMWENYPRFMAHVREVRGEGQRSHWAVDGPGGIPVSWDADVTQFVPNEVLAWRSVEGAGIQQAGVMHFERTEDEGTRLHIRMSYNPPAGALGHAVANLLGVDPERQMDEDFHRLKSLIEEGKTSSPTQGEVTRDQLAA
jgi:uncharacterized membrane protein